MQKELYSVLKRTVEESGLPFYREPLMGTADTDSSCITRLKSIVHPDHLLPGDILPGCRSVVAYFLPFREDIVRENRQGRSASRLWAEVYIVTNRLLQKIAEKMKDRLAAEGFRCAWEKPTHNFDEDLLVSYWSHKHLAFACGLGRFGRNQLLITGRGCAGRLGSLVTDCHLESDQYLADTPFYSCPEGCSYCERHCPAGALGEGGLDRKACYKILLENDRLYPDLDLCDVCGKCSTGPCAVF